MNIHETVLRYEGPVRTSNANFLSLQRRIKEDEELAAKQNQAYNELKDNEIAKWEEKLEEKAGYIRAMNDMRQCKAEITQAGKASIMVRRKALELQIKRDMAQYDTELQTQCKTFYKLRI